MNQDTENAIVRLTNWKDFLTVRNRLAQNRGVAQLAERHFTSVAVSRAVILTRNDVKRNGGRWFESTPPRPFLISCIRC